jgi:predicted CXXCH cytochrome family protein
MQTSIRTAVGLVTAVALLLVAAPARPDVRVDEDDVIRGGTTQCELLTQSRWTGTTKGCLSCHDGSVAMAANYAIGAPHKGVHSSHPVEVYYASASRSGEHKLHPPGALPAALVMPEGKVTCVTCHDGKSTIRYHVAMSNDRSRLCFSCHAI